MSVTCPKCQSAMAPGFIPDKFDKLHGKLSVWRAGEAKSSFWAGVTSPDETTIPIRTFRCVKCGYLESYARPEFAAS
ncbi:MAG TPA: hypothetical protein VIU61_16360 [Kofleriaceae bacterium]